MLQEVLLWQMEATVYGNLPGQKAALGRVIQSSKERSTRWFTGPSRKLQKITKRKWFVPGLSLKRSGSNPGRDVPWLHVGYPFWRGFDGWT